MPISNVYSKSRTTKNVYAHTVRNLIKVWIEISIIYYLFLFIYLSGSEPSWASQWQQCRSKGKKHGESLTADGSIIFHVNGSVFCPKLNKQQRRQTSVTVFMLGLFYLGKTREVVELKFALGQHLNSSLTGETHQANWPFSFCRSNKCNIHHKAEVDFLFASLRLEFAVPP